ncbi:MAG: hypothetical protein WCO25_05305 [Candidatus Uhrbacteria bacterium]
MKEIKGVVAPKPKESPPPPTAAKSDRLEKSAAKFKALHVADREKNAPTIDEIRKRWNPPALPAREAPRVLSPVDQEMEDAFNATPKGRETGATLRAGRMEKRPLTAEEMRKTARERMLLDALPAARTKEDQNRIYAQLYKQGTEQKPSP